MMHHAMSYKMKVVDHLNPGQVPMMAVDQPLYALGKQIQWTHPELGEDKFVTMMGGLHRAGSLQGAWQVAGR